MNNTIVGFIKNCY